MVMVMIILKMVMTMKTVEYAEQLNFAKRRDEKATESSVCICFVLNLYSYLYSYLYLYRFFTGIDLHLQRFVLVLFWICIVVHLYYFVFVLFCNSIILDLYSCIFVFAGELKFRKEKRVKKPLQIACNGQYFQSVDVIMINMILMRRMMKMRMRMWLI